MIKEGFQRTEKKVERRLRLGGEKIKKEKQEIRSPLFLVDFAVRLSLFVMHTEQNYQ